METVLLRQMRSFRRLPQALRRQQQQHRAQPAFTFARCAPHLVLTGPCRLQGFCAKADNPAQVDVASKFTGVGDGQEKEELEQPTRQQLKRVYINSAVPFVAFGFVDQSVLIYMGDAIDNTVGVMFGFPTLAAAAMGQIFSDTAGVAFGGTIEACAMKLGLPLPGLSEEQQHLGVVRRVATFGGICGVICGCLLGMVNLLVIDLAAAERAKRAKELATIFKSVMDDGREVVGCERATLWVVEEDNNELWSSVAHGVSGILRIPLDGPSIACLAARESKMVNIPDVTKDERFKATNPIQGFVTKNMLVSPVMLEDKCVAVIQLLNKVDEQGKDSTFSQNDMKMVEMMSKHTAIFINNLS